MLITLIENLYSSNADFSLLLQDSIYITEFDHDDDHVFFHTGCKYLTTNTKAIEIYFELSSKIIVRAPVSPYFLKPPQLIGFLASRNSSEYIDQALDYIAVSINSHNYYNTTDEKHWSDGLGLVEHFDLDSLIRQSAPVNLIKVADAQHQIHEISRFEIQSDQLVSFPLHKTYSRPVSLGKRAKQGFSFEEPRPQSKEEWLEDEFGDDADTAFWNIN